MNDLSATLRWAASWTRRPNMGGWLLVLPAVLLLAVFYTWPILKILWISFVEIDDKAVGHALGNYGLILTDDGIQRLLWRTARICLLATTITVICGYVIAYVMTHVGRQQRSLMLFGVLVTFWLSVLIRAFAWIVVLRNNGPVHALLDPFWQALLGLGLVEGRLQLVRNEAGVIIGMVHYMIPYAVLPLFSNMQGIDQRILQAARGLGCTPFKAFRTTFLPLSMPGLMASTILVFVFSLGFFVTPALLGGGKVVMISEYIYFSMGQTLRWGLATMLSTTLLVSSLALILLILRFAGSRPVFGGR
jgi:putative spermidine/putrescine transport system permease protein